MVVLGVAPCNLASSTTPHLSMLVISTSFDLLPDLIKKALLHHCETTPQKWWLTGCTIDSRKVILVTLGW